jgi:transcriptional regulator with XRE-family HTH domain
MKRRASGAKLVAARELLGWTRNAVSEKIGVLVGSIGDAELGRGGAVNVDRLIALYEAAGVEFLPDGQVVKERGAK